MPASKIRSVILFILALTAGFLLLLVVPNRLALMREQQTVRTRLSALFERSGIRLLDADSLPEGEKLTVVEWNDPQDAGAKSASVLLQNAVRIESGSSRYFSAYSGDNGTCAFGTDGSFSAELTNSPQASDLRSDAEKRLRAIGFSCAAVSEAKRVEAGVYELTCTQSVLGVPIFSEGLRLRYVNNALVHIEGTFFCGEDTLTRTGTETCISCADALTAFLAGRDLLGWVGSEVRSVRQGYRHADTATSTVRMVPAWQIETDTGAFFVNGITREITPIGE